MNPTLIVQAPPLSQSLYEKMACPHLYVENIIKGVEEPDNEYSTRGTQFHRAAKDYTDHLVKTKQATDLEWFRSNILTRHQYLPDAIELLENHGENFVIDPDKVFDTELYLPLDHDLNPMEDAEPGNPLVCYQGTPDLLTLAEPEYLIIDDYKTFFRITDPDTFQSEFYPLLAFKHFRQVEAVEFRLWFVRYGVKRSRKFTRADIPALEKKAREARARQLDLHREHAIWQTEKAPMPGPHCAYCPKLQHGCPIADLNPYTNMTPEDRLKFAIWVNEAKKQNDRILKDLVDAQGPICIADANGKGYQAQFDLQRKGHYSATVLPIITANEPALVDSLTIGGLSSKLKTKGRAKLKELCEEHRFEKSQTRFAIHGVDLAEDADAADSQAAD